MNILFLTLAYPSAGINNIYTDLLDEFVRDGNDVWVVCQNERRTGKPTQCREENGKTILRVKTLNITGEVGIVEKGIATAMIDRVFLTTIKKHFRSVKFDLILYSTPPITLSGCVKRLKNEFGATTYLLLKDIFPQNAVDLGMLTTSGVKGLIYCYFRHKEKKLYKVSDYIGCMSPANCRYVLDHNPEVSTEKLEVCPNCVRFPQTSPIYSKDSSLIRGKYNIPDDSIIFLYGGNLGKPQGINFLIQCLEKEKVNSKVFFIIIGSGTEYTKIQRFMSEQKPSNALLLDYLPKDEYEAIANQCDVGMIFLDHRFTIPNYPSRLLPYLASGIPVLVASDVASDMGRISEENGFGFWCESNSVTAFSEVVSRMVGADRTEMGKNAWNYVTSHYSVQIGQEIISKHFRKNI